MRKDMMNNWVIVMQGDFRFIGKLLSGSTEDITINPAYEINVHVIPVPTERGIMMNKQITCSPILLTLDSTILTIRGNYTVQRLNDMSAQDQNRYADLVANAEKMATHQRAQDAGIVIAAPGAGR